MIWANGPPSQGRPTKPPYPASGRVVKACHMLGDELKILWLEHVVLDRTEGAYISAEHMAQRLGKSKDSIERGRRELLRVGLLQKGQRARGQTGTWYPVLPAACIPSARPTPADISGLANRLDDHIRAIRSGGEVLIQRGTDHYFSAKELDTVERKDPAARLKVAAPVQVAAVLEAARMRPECRTDAASLPHSRPEIRAQSGGSDDATLIPRG